MEINEIYDLALAVLEDESIRSSFFLAGKDEVFLSWGQKSPEKKLPYVLNKPFTSSKNASENIWKNFSTPDCYCPEFFIYQNKNHDKFCQLPSSLPKKKDLTENLNRLHLKPQDEDEASWIRYCKRIEEAFLETNIKKVVPARMKTYNYSFKKNVDLKRKILSKLFNEDLSHNFLFFVKAHDDLFLGLSPELLFKFEKNSLLVPALAGTRKRGKSDLEDKELMDELLGSQKEQAEHAFVVSYLKNELTKLHLSCSCPEAPEVLKLKNLQHLYTPLKGHLENGQIIEYPEKMMNLLHPTPAIVGFPPDEAWSLIEQNENFKRGLYSSPLGFLLPNGNAICIIAIRSMLIRSEKIHLFAGAGYVKGSNPAQEWQETHEKMKTMSQLFDT